MLYVRYHTSPIAGWTEDRGQVLIQALNDRITLPQLTFKYVWVRDNVVMWDSRCVLHRARPFDRSKYRHVMQRTTVIGDGPTAPA